MKPKQSASLQNGPSIKELAVQLNFNPVNEELFEIAFHHSSYANEHNLPSNERLEFLGDSVLALIICNFVYELYPKYSEGQLAKLKSTIVSTGVFATFAQQLRLNDFIRLGHGELRSHGAQKKNLLADLFEAFIGAYYLNFGLEKTTEFVLSLVKPCLPELIRQTEELNVKTRLQELAQSQGCKPPDYRLVKEEGPPHNRTFTVDLAFNGKTLSQGRGKSLQEAQNKAAAAALAELVARGNEI
jgi:ribonuclease-3